MNIKNSEAKPARCPWCGRDAKVAWLGWDVGDENDHWRVICKGLRCRSAGPIRQTDRGAIKAWNAPADFAREP